MGNPDKGFAGKTTKFAMTVLSTAVIIASSSTMAHGKKKETTDRDKDKILPPYTVQTNGEPGAGFKHKNRRVNRKPQNLSVSKDFKFYKQVASLDLTDPIQAETFLQFMDIRLAEKELNEEVVLVKDNGPTVPEKTAQADWDEMLTAAEQTGRSETQKTLRPQAGTDLCPAVQVMPVKKAEEKQEAKKIARPVKVNRKKEWPAPRSGTLLQDKGKTADKLKPVEPSATDKEKEQSRTDRVTERRKFREQAKTEKQKNSAFRLVAEKRKAEEKARAKNYKAEELRQAEKKREETAARQEAEQTEQIKRAASHILPSRPIAYQMASEEDPRIINFDQAITRRFKVSGSYLDKGEHGNNIVNDNRGREFLNVIAFWDVLVEPQSNGENHYYGSIQFPLGSRHPAIIKSTVPGDEINQGCRASEVLVLRGFETEGVDYTHGLVDAYLAHSMVLPDGTIAFQEVVRQPSFSLINVETGCLSRDIFSRSHVDPERMGHDKTLYALPVRE